VSINSESDRAASLVIGPTSLGMVRVYVEADGIELPMDFEPDEAIEIADRGIAAAKKHLTRVPDDQEARLHMAMLLARMGLGDDARNIITQARRRAPKDAYTSFHVACVHALLGEIEPALALLQESQERGFYLRPELMRNTDLELLRGRREFVALLS